MTKRENLSILHVTDLHFNRAACEWLGEQHAVDAICISGDLFDDSINAGLSLSEQATWYRQFLMTLSVPIYICSGNHDIEKSGVASQEITEDLDASLDTSFDDDELYLIPDSITCGETNWVTALAAPSIHIDGTIAQLKGWTFGCSRYDTSDYCRFSDCDVLLAHVPPAGTDTALHEGQDWGSSELELALQTATISPKYLLCGHAHRPHNTLENKWHTTISNPGGSAKGTIPKYKIIHLSAN